VTSFGKTYPPHPHPHPTPKMSADEQILSQNAEYKNRNISETVNPIKYKNKLRPKVTLPRWSTELQLS